MNCPLCAAAKDEGLLFFDGKLSAAFVPTNPLNEFHCLVVPKRHVSKVSGFTGGELKEMFDTIARI